MGSVRLASVQKFYGTHPVLRDINLTVKDGEFLAILGKSGCGKSTLLRIIAGLEMQSQGSIHISEKDVSMLRPARRGIAMVFQSYALYPHLTVKRNLTLGLTKAGERAEIIAERLVEAVRILDLAPLIDRKPGQLSGGQRQRVAIGRAIMRHPDVFLFDEPLSNLDASLRNQVRGEIADLHRKLGATMIYVTHDQVEAMTLADRIVLMHEGVVQQIGTPMELYKHPANLFVATFIGSPMMNLFDIDTISKVSDDIRSKLSLLRAQHANITIGVRPGDIEIGKDEERLSNWKIASLEYLGSTVYCHVVGESGTKIIVDAGADIRLSVGANVCISVKRNTEFYFGEDKQSIAT